MKNKAEIKGMFVVRCFDKNKKLVWEELIKNLTTTEGLNHMLDVEFHGSTQITTWYFAIFEDDHTPAAGDTYASPGYTECTAYDEATRQEFVEAAASSGSVTNSENVAELTISASKTLYGAALVGGGSAATTKGDSAGGGTLHSLVQFSSSQSVDDGYTVEITYTINVANG